MATFTNPQFWQSSGTNFIRPKGTKGIVLENNENLFLGSGSSFSLNDSYTTGYLNSLLPTTGSAYFKIQINNSSSPSIGQGIFVIEHVNSSDATNIPFIKLKNSAIYNSTSGILDIQSSRGSSLDGRVRFFNRPDTAIDDVREPVEGELFTADHYALDIKSTGITNAVPFHILFSGTNESMRSPAISIKLLGS